MFFSLAFETGLETASAGVDDENSKVGLAGAGDHIGDEISMAGSVKYREFGLFGFKFISSDVDGDTPIALLGTLIQNPSEGEG